MASTSASSEEFSDSVQDIRKFVVREVFENEKSYVESLENIITDYMMPLKSRRYSHLLSANLVDEIFGQIPILIYLHQEFLEKLKTTVENTDVKPNIGDIFLKTFFRDTVAVESYTLYAKHYKRANEIVLQKKQSKFRTFLELTAREHSRKLALDMLLIAPLQIFSKYKLLLSRLVKHTQKNDPEHTLLLSAQQQVDDLLLKMDCVQKQDIELEQLRKLQSTIDGLTDLAILGRQYLRHDSASVCFGAARPKKRDLFLFSDLLIIVKRRSTRMQHIIACANLSSRSNNMSYVTEFASQSSAQNSLNTKTYKLLIRIPLKDAQIIKPIDDCSKQILVQTAGHHKHPPADQVVANTLVALNKQLIEELNIQSPCLNVIAFTSNGKQNLSILFFNAETRTSWEKTVMEAKQRLALSGIIQPWPELFVTIPKRTTKSELQSKFASLLNLRKGWDNDVGEELLEQEIHLDNSSSDEDYNCDKEYVEDIQWLVNLETCSIENEQAVSQSTTVLMSTLYVAIYVYYSEINIRTKKIKTKAWFVVNFMCDVTFKYNIALFYNFFPDILTINCLL